MPRAVWIGASVALVLALGLQLAPPSTATTVSTGVEVANAAPTLESHRASTVSDGGAWVAWVWVSDANGVGDLEAVELLEDGRTLAATGAPTWTADGVARFTLEVPDGGEGPAGNQVRVRDAAGAVDAVAFEPSIDEASTQLAKDGSTELRSVPGPGLGALLAVLGVVLSGRGLRRPRSPAPRRRRPRIPNRSRPRRRRASARRAR